LLNKMEKDYSLKKTVILIAAHRKDSALILETLQKIPDLEMIWVESEQETLASLLEQPVSLIILDVQLLQGSGDRIATLVREQACAKPISIILVGDAGNIQVQLFMEHACTAVDFVVKPVEPFILKNKLILLLELQRTKHLLEEKSKELEEKTLELEVLHNELEEKSEKLELLSSLDGLTGLFNRRYFDDNLVKEWRKAIRDQAPLSLIIIDIDYFQNYRDYYGHLQGDTCLCKVALALYETLLRPVDIVARYGREEFAVILPNTGRAGAEMVARRMQDGVAGLAILHKTSSAAPQVTISIGGSTIVPAGKISASLLLDRAEKALKEAKGSGRNCFRITGSEPTESGFYDGI
jgi:diguanylate cyclase (GGDEF)-like protein